MSKILETVFGMVRGGVHPREVAMAVMLGTLAGFVTGWNFTLVAVLLLVLVVRAPLNVFGQAWGAAAALSLALTPLTHRTGRSLLENSSFGHWLAGHADSVWLALFDWDRYTLVGGVVWALVLGLPAAFFVGRLTRSLQKRFHKLQERLDADQQQWKARFTVRAACWMVFGGYEKAAPPQTRPRLFRKLGLVAMALVLAPAGFAAWMYGPSFAENSFLYTLTAANRAEVNADDMQLSLSDGLLNIYNLQISDPDNLDQDRFRIKQVTAVVRPGPLLRGQVLIDKILLEGITSDEPRAERAKPFSVHIPGFDEKPESPQAAPRLTTTTKACWASI